jgi:hypothetical protein
MSTKWSRLALVMKDDLKGEVKITNERVKIIHLKPERRIQSADKEIAKKKLK